MKGSGETKKYKEEIKIRSEGEFRKGTKRMKKKCGERRGQGMKPFLGNADVLKMQ